MCCQNSSRQHFILVSRIHADGGLEIGRIKGGQHNEQHHHAGVVVEGGTGRSRPSHDPQVPAGKELWFTRVLADFHSLISFFATTS